MARLSKMAGALSAAEFKNAAARFPKLSEKAKAVARAILVDGYTPEQAAAEFVTTRQLTHQWATKIYEAFRPTGWVTEAVTLPRDLMEKVKEMEKAAREQWEGEQPPPRFRR